MVRNQYPKPKERNLILGENVTQTSVAAIIKSIYDINLDDEEHEATYVDYERPPIHLILNTYGGSVYDGLGLIGAIELSTTPIIVTCLGSAMSMGLYILASGHHRRAHHLSTIMYHEMSTFAWEKLEGIKKTLDECNRLEKLCDGILQARTKIREKDLQSYKTRKDEWYMSAQDALKWGIIDEIIGAPLLSQEAAEQLEKEAKEAKEKKGKKTTDKPTDKPVRKTRTRKPTKQK